MEHIMSILNLGFQSIGLMRSQMKDEAEHALKNCNSIAQLRASGESYKGDIKESLKPTITLLINIVQRLELKGKKFEVFSGATEEDIQNFWEVLQTIDSTLTCEETTKKAIKGKKDLEAFLSHCCVARHYSISIKKCGEDNCSICKSIRMPKDVFQMLRHLADPMMGNDDHYLSFEDVYNTKTSENDCPSLSNAKKVKTLPFVPTSRHVQNVKVMVQCEECDLCDY